MTRQVIRQLGLISMTPQDNWTGKYMKPYINDVDPSRNRTSE